LHFGGAVSELVLLERPNEPVLLRIAGAVTALVGLVICIQCNAL
jgi:hypothetical protein